MGWLEFLIVMVFIIALITALSFWQIRSFGYAAIFGFLFVFGVFVMMQSPLGDQIRREIREHQAAASKVKQTG
jgi:hypothetical protein